MNYNVATESLIQSITTWSMTPGVSVGPLRFGMSRDQIKQVMLKWLPKFNLPDDFQPKLFKKTNTSASDVEDWRFAHFYYSSSDKLEAVEVWGHKGFSISCPIFTSKNMDVKLFQVIPTNITEVIKGFIKFSPTIQLDVGNGAIIAKTLSLAVAFNDEYAAIDSCLFGVKGYFK